MWIAFSTPKASTISHSQEWPVKTTHPSRSSATKDALERASVRGGIRTLNRSNAESSQVTESTASAQPGPTVTTSTAAADGPTIASDARCIESSTFAGWSWPRGTRLGTTLVIAGKLAAARVPLTAARTIRCQSSAEPVSTSVAMAPWERPAPTLVTRSTVARLNRSAITPPTSRKTTRGDALGGQHPAEGAGGGGEVEHREGERHRCHAQPEQVHEPGSEEPPEAGALQRRERGLPRRGGPAHADSSSCSGTGLIGKSAAVMFIRIVPSVWGGRASPWTSELAFSRRARALA
jgi:hypothetical protein